MARTPLFDALRRMARDYKIAQSLGVPVSAVDEIRREQRASRGVSRRAFVAGGAALGASLALAGRTQARARRSSQPKIAIVGAGISGLSAALALDDRGLNCTIYDSSKRIGGRMFSNTKTFAGNQVSEWCGELIDTGHTTIQELAARFGLPLDDLHEAEPPGSEDTNYFFGHYYSRAQALADFAPVFAATSQDLEAADYPTTYDHFKPGGKALDSISVHDWIESRVPGGHASPMGRLLDVTYGPEYGADTTDQSALNILYLLGFQPTKGGFELLGESDERFHIRGGNQQLPLAIAASLDNATKLKLGRALESVRLKSDGRYELTFHSPNGVETEVVDYVILTLPFAVLRTLDTSLAGFDALKNVAIQELGRGHNGKLQMQFTSRLWNHAGPWGISNGSSQSDTGYEQSWDVTRAQYGQRGILNVYTGGSITDSLATQNAFVTQADPKVLVDVAFAQSKLAPVFPGLAPLWNGRATSSLPHESEHFRCSYSYWRVGQYTKFSGYEAVRQGNVFFGGEHTSTDFQGFMEGAASEGLRAGIEVAEQILGN